MTLSILLTFGLLFIGLTLTLPMFVVLTGTSFLVFAVTTPLPLSILPQRVFAGLESFPLLAIPFFILAANIMGQGGLSERIVAFIRALVGHLPGGLAITVVVTCMLFGAITGSSASTIVAVGGLLFPALVKAGYPERFSLGLVTCSALIGMIIPPSNAMIVYGAVANASIGVAASVALAGIEDCNQNGIDDAEDIALGISEDCQANGIPDEAFKEIDARHFPRY